MKNSGEIIGEIMEEIRRIASTETTEELMNQIQQNFLRSSGGTFEHLLEELQRNFWKKKIAGETAE